MTNLLCSLNIQLIRNRHKINKIILSNMGGAKVIEDKSSYLRKVRKPLVERKRRERMNHSIDQLKDLISDTIKQNVEPMTRVDKADILELTVAHLAQQNKHHNNHRNVAMATSTSGYSNGYQDCAKEVVKFLASNSLVDRATLDCINGYLNNASVEKSRNEHAFGKARPDLYCSTPMRPHTFGMEKQLASTSTPAYLSPIPLAVHNVSDSRTGFGTCSSGMSLSSSNSGSSGDFKRYSSMGYSSDGFSNVTQCSFRTSSFSESGLSSGSSCHVPSSSESGLNPRLQSRVHDSQHCCHEFSSSESGLSSGVMSSRSSNHSGSHSEYSGVQHSNSDIVSIGEGKENAIGHVIKDTTWRPW